MERRAPVELTEKERCEIKFESARINLIAMVIISVVNLAFFVFGQTYLVPFSASIPYYAVVFSYVGGYLPTTVGWMIAMAFFGVNVICWIRSKQDWRWLLVSFCLFTLDTIACLFVLANGVYVSFWPDIVFHAWIVYYMSTGVRYARKLEKIPGSKLSNRLQDEE